MPLVPSGRRRDRAWRVAAFGPYSSLTSWRVCWRVERTYPATVEVAEIRVALPPGGGLKGEVLWSASVGMRFFSPGPDEMCSEVFSLPMGKRVYLTLYPAMTGIAVRLEPGGDASAPTGPLG